MNFVVVPIDLLDETNPDSDDDDKEEEDKEEEDKKEETLETKMR